MKKKKKIEVMNIIIFAILLLYTLLMFLTLAWAVLSSFKTAHAFYRDPLGIPKQWTLDIYAKVMEYNYVRVTYSDGRQADFTLFYQIINTLLYAGIGSLVSMLVPCLTAYVCSKYSFSFNKVVTSVVIITMILPIVGAYSSELRILRALGLYDRIWGNWIQKANPLGMYFLVFKAFFANMSDSYIEAARVEGASEFRIMTSISIPLAAKIMITVYLILFVANWNDYQTILMYLPSWPTLAVGIYKLSHSTYNELSNVPSYMAGCVILTVPIITLFLIFKNKMMGNISMGGVKE